MFCCFTGHRPKNLPWGTRENDERCLIFKKILLNTVENLFEEGYTDFYCGMAIGTDIYLAEAVLSLCESGKNVRLHAAIPCPEQFKGWSEKERQRYGNILSRCHSKTLISPFYSDSCMLTRNRFMVDNSDLVLAVWNGNLRGGTYYTVKYAKTQGRKIILINPKNPEVKTL